MEPRVVELATISMLLASKYVKMDGLHIGHLLEVTLLQERKECAGDEMSTGDIGSERGFKISPRSTSQLETPRARE